MRAIAVKLVSLNWTSEIMRSGKRLPWGGGGGRVIVTFGAVILVARSTAGRRYRSLKDCFKKNFFARIKGKCIICIAQMLVWHRHSSLSKDGSYLSFVRQKLSP